MSIKYIYSRRVTFDTRDELGDKIDKLTVMIGKLAARDSGSGRQFKPQIYQGKRRGQNRGSYDRHSFDQQDYQNRYRSDSGDRRQYRQGRGRPRYEQNYRGENFKGNARTYQNFERQSSRGEYRNNHRDKGYGRRRDGNRSRERSFSRDFSNRSNMIGVQVIVGPDQDQGPVQIETESGVTNVGNMIILQRIVLHPGKKGN